MEQLVLDISSEKDAILIKELLKRFKSVSVNDFSTRLSSSLISKRIKAGRKDADKGNTRTWREVKSNLQNRIKANEKQMLKLILTKRAETSLEEITDYYLI